VRSQPKRKRKANSEKMMAMQKADQEKGEAERKVDREVATRVEAIHDKSDTNQMIVEPEMKTNQEKMGAMDLKRNLEEMECESENREIPKEDAIVKPVKGGKKRHRNRMQVAGQRGEPKELN
jgi:hypothetical protein